MFDVIIGVLTVVLSIVILMSSLGVLAKVVLCVGVFIASEFASKYFGNNDGQGGVI